MGDQRMTTDSERRTSMGKRKKTGSVQAERCCGCGEMVNAKEEEILHCSGCGEAVCSLCVNTQTDGEVHCPSCVEKALEASQNEPGQEEPEEEDHKAIISIPRGDGTMAEADLDEVMEAIKQTDDTASLKIMGETIREEAMKKDAAEIRAARIKIRICEEKKKALTDEIKGLNEKISTLSYLLCDAVLDPQLYLDEVQKQMELENALSRGEDPSQLTLEDE